MEEKSNGGLFMGRINLDHWFVKENELSISLMHFYVSISSCFNNNEIYYLVKVINNDSEIKEIQYGFNSLEEAIFFVENDVSICWTFDEVNTKYKEFNSSKQKTFKKEM